MAGNGSDKLALVQQQKAMSVKKYLFGDNMRKQLEMAVPKWLSVDRLLRVAFSSILQNPKLLDCTAESIMGSLIRCAQVGLEPVMGRAYLVPYQNNRKPGKPLECQFQVGYQGLVDLGRRSGEIKDVKAHVVYASDQFELEYGDNERLFHKPNWEAPERGEPIGAYAVWIYRDGYKSTTFMPIRDIYAIRDRSQAWQAHKKYGSDCPWTTDPGEMIKKTAIKRSAKLAPASIEFMQAVEMDNAAEFGTTPSLPLGNTIGALGEGEGPTSEELQAEFEKAVGPLLSRNTLTSEQVDRFLALAVETYGQTMDEVRAAALDDMENFIASVDAWARKQTPQPEKSGNGSGNKPESTSPSEENDPAVNSQDEDPRRAEYINLRSSGFSTWVWKHYNRIHSDQFTDTHREEIRAKWAKLYPDQPFPSRENETVQKSAAANGNGDYIWCSRAQQRKPREVCEKKCSYRNTCDDYAAATGKANKAGAPDPAAEREEISAPDNMKAIWCPDLEENVDQAGCQDCVHRAGCPSWDNDEQI